MNLFGKIINTLKDNSHIKSSLKKKKNFSFLIQKKTFKLRMKDSILSIKDKNIIEKMIGKEDEESKGKKKK